MASAHLLPIPDKRDADATVALEKAGVVFGKKVDKLFVEATLPDGWSVKPTKHHLYSDLVDNKGRKRAGIMIHVLDNDAWMSPTKRFNPSYIKDDWSDRSSPYIPVIEDSNSNVLWRGTANTGMDAARDISRTKLSEIAPNWRNLQAYWGEDGDSIVFPPHETPIDTRATYSLWVNLYMDGRHADGGEHNTVKANSDDEAKDKLSDSTSMKYLGSYEVRWSIKCGDRLVDSGTLYPPRRRNEPLIDNCGRVIDYGRNYNDGW